MTKATPFQFLQIKPTKIQELLQQESSYPNYVNAAFLNTVSC